ncbi:MAG: SIR2 family protein [Hydrogenophilaceae bacterium]|jgi:hypothetical protein|nr:SIR2 family protein [Hydrogenophilaceae bacterium]
MIETEVAHRMEPGIRGGQYNLLLGSGISLDSHVLRNGKAVPIPSAKQLRDELCQEKKVHAGSSLQRVYQLLSSDEVRSLITPRFRNSVPGPTASLIASFNWRRIFTLNVDDALEAALRKDKRKPKFRVFNYCDLYSEPQVGEGVPIAHLHGYAPREEDGYIFSQQEYANQIRSINAWAHNLTHFLLSEPFIVMGTTLEEIDIEYFLSFRDAVGSRTDKPPSFLVEPFPDAATVELSRRRNLTLYEGDALTFLNELGKAIPNAKSPLPVVPADIRQIISPDTKAPIAAAFAADFEFVPSRTDRNADQSTDFLYGHTISWPELDVGLDVSRKVTTSLQSRVTAAIRGANNAVVVLHDEPGGGKTTVLRRIGWETARAGAKVFWCKAIGRLDPNKTVEAIGGIEGPVVLLIDNFADHVDAALAIAANQKRSGIVIVGAERAYRLQHIGRVMGAFPTERVPGAKLLQTEANALVQLYASKGLVGEKDAIQQPEHFSREISNDEIAVACCRILNDFQPLERIVLRAWQDADQDARYAYLVCAIVDRCVRVGLRYGILAKLAGGKTLAKQLSETHPLPLDFTDYPINEFVRPLNAIVADQALNVLVRKERRLVFDAAVELGLAISPYVNRGTIKQRLPEPRLAQRLFDLDVVLDLLGPLTREFYEALKTKWEWNSRYWEQVSLLNLRAAMDATSEADRQRFATNALQNARHAVTIERHPFTLTTLAKVILWKRDNVDQGSVQMFAEAFGHLTRAIELERRSFRVTVHPYMTLLQAVRRYLERGGRLTPAQTSKVNELLPQAQAEFAHDAELSGTLEAIRRMA